MVLNMHNIVPHTKKLENKLHLPFASKTFIYKTILTHTILLHIFQHKHSKDCILLYQDNSTRKHMELITTLPLFH